MSKNIEIFESEKLSIANFNGSTRFIIIAEAEHGCCNGFTIIDTKKGVNEYEQWIKPLCEVRGLSEATAKTICRALNNHCRIRTNKKPGC